MKRISSITLACFFAAVLVAALAGCAQSAPSTAQQSASSSAPEAIGIIGAMDEEVDSLKEAAEIERTTTIASMDFNEGTLGGKRVVIVQCGMGKVNAGICAHTLIKDFGCTKIINSGVAGSLDSRLNIGDIVVSEDAVQHDFDVEPIGFKKGEIPYTELYAFPADEALRSLAVSTAKEVAPEVGVYEGRICTGDQFISTKEQKDAIVSDFGGLCCEMEGGAVAQTCYLNDTPFVIIRAISDKSDSTDESESVEYETFKADAAAHVAGIVQHMVEAL